MKKAMLGLVFLILGFEIPAYASEFQEVAMCATTAPNAAFPRISIQAEPGKANRAILILTASDGWTQVYSGPVKSSSAVLAFDEDTHVVSATFSKSTLRAKISFNGDDYICDERSFGN
jgi:hypothetical protein